MGTATSLFSRKAMGANTKIEWCDHSWNPWLGCTKVSPACDHCYAEGWAKRSGLVTWGHDAERRKTSDANWKLPIKWNADAARRGVRYMVFCASLADVFDNAVPVQWRISLIKLICETPHLDWLLLTKRIGNAAAMLESAFRAVHHQREGWADNFLPNVWLGATVCNQTEADRDIPKLLDVPAAKRFLSIEPMLGPVNLTKLSLGIFAAKANALTGKWKWEDGPTKSETPPLDWVIVGGESGPGARPMHPDWVTSIRDQCANTDTPFMFKQWGEWKPICQ
jgi:protein gp37